MRGHCITHSPYHLRQPHFQPTSAIKKPKTSTLHETGFQIISHAINIDQRVLDNAHRACDRKIPIIFNHNEINKHNDFKRRQRNLPMATQYMKHFDEQVKNLVQRQVNTSLIPTDPVILHSLPGCQPQAAHCDYIPDEALKAVPDQLMPLAALICLMPGTHLKVWPNSARLATANEKDLKNVAPISCEEVELHPGDMLIFRGDFVHAGSGYEKENYRIHYYLDSPLVPRTKNRTWIIQRDGNEAMRNIILPDSNTLDIKSRSQHR